MLIQINLKNIMIAEKMKAYDARPWHHNYTHSYELKLYKDYKFNPWNKIQYEMEVWQSDEIPESIKHDDWQTYIKSQ